MKTIEQASYDALNESPSYVVNAASVFHEGFARGIEFAQRWIPVEEDLPCAGNRKEFFLIKGFYEIKENHILAFTQLSSLMSITEDGTTIWSGINDDETELFFNCVVTHWRPIEYK